MLSSNGLDDGANLINVTNVDNGVSATQLDERVKQLEIENLLVSKKINVHKKNGHLAPILKINWSETETNYKLPSKVN